MSTVQKNDLIIQVASSTGISKHNVTLVVNSFLDEVVLALKDQNVKVAGFGSFIAENKPERQGRNPQNGEKLTIPARRSVRFKASSGLKDKVNE